MQTLEKITKTQKYSIAIDSKDYKAIAIDKIQQNNLESIAKADKNKRIEANATMLMETLKAEPQWLRFFCKCLHQLSEGTIAYILEGAKKADNPCRYFCASAKREMNRT